MNADELNMLMNALRELGASGKAAFVWWLVCDKLVPVVAWLAALTAVLHWGARPLIAMNDAVQGLKYIRDRLDVGCPGHLTSSEIEAVKRKINRMIEGDQP